MCIFLHRKCKFYYQLCWTFVYEKKYNTLYLITPTDALSNKLFIVSLKKKQKTTKNTEKKIHLFFRFVLFQKFQTLKSYVATCVSFSMQDQTSNESCYVNLKTKKKIQYLLVDHIRSGTCAVLLPEAKKAEKKNIKAIIDPLLKFLDSAIFVLLSALPRVT